MLSNYLKIAFRNILKSKLFSLINILGMALSLTIVFVIALYINDELAYDQHVENASLKYRIFNDRQSREGVANKLPIVPYPFATYIQKDFPEVKQTVRIMDSYGELLLEVADKKISEKGGFYTEGNVFSMLSLRVLDGNPLSLNEPSTVALSESLAKKYFPNGGAIGQTIKISKDDFNVTCIYADPPAQSHLHPAFLMSLQTFARNWGPQRTENWIWQQFFTYIEFHQPVDRVAFEQKLFDFVKKYAYEKTDKDGFRYTPHLQAMEEIHLNSSDFEWEAAERGDAQMVLILGMTGVFVLVISCLNFINLSTARAVKRMKEVGVRKVIGAYRTQLIAQFISESVLITLMGLVLAVALTEISLPILNDFSDKQIEDPLSATLALALTSCVVVLGVLAGCYPAFYLSKMKPALIFRNREGRGSVEFFRKSLVVLQFAFSFLLIIGAMIVLAQNDLLRNKDMGFNRDEIIVLPLRKVFSQNPESTKQQFLSIPNVESASMAFGIPGSIVAGDGVVDPTTGQNLTTNLFLVDHDYLPTFEMKLIAGKNFSATGADSSNFIVNESAVKNFNFGTPEEAIGKKLEWGKWSGGRQRGEIIGVVKDFNFRSLKEKVEPAVMISYDQSFGSLSLRVKTENLSETLAQIQALYSKLESNWPFEYSFLDDKFKQMYQNEEKLSSLLSFFTGFALFIACLGLFGLVEYSVNQKAKEISIRKVFGAGIPSLLLLLTRKYFLLIAIAFAMVVPVGYYLAEQWLQNFAYRIEISPVLFLKAAGMIMLITALTVIFQSLRAALSNPAHVLKNE